ncbi:hypothetical protein [Puia dinghuensis]|uniref:Uncharacterized protein n=1 Tax=Puia dinghuensis TaxID=1792502 RepID=A0A8J2UBK4_9BACT|nr:hypothetical protein [Puia dinghuensis]GGA92424.1 hypothetical protein GCM10011511_14780 [Puia dinghuensis]
MTAILLEPDKGTKAYVYLSDIVDFYDKEVTILLKTEKCFGVTDSTETVQIVSDAFCLNKDNLGMQLNVFPTPLFGTVVITGWDNVQKKSCSLPSDFTLSSFSVQFFDSEQTKQKKVELLKAYRGGSN